MEESSGSSQEKEQQQLTIFYGGKIYVCDVTELRARSILLLASQAMEEKSETRLGSEPSSASSLYSLTAGLSMKRSLQQFLQKRKNRIQASSPYYRL